MSPLRISLSWRYFRPPKYEVSGFPLELRVRHLRWDSQEITVNSMQDPVQLRLPAAESLVQCQGSRHAARLAIERVPVEVPVEKLELCLENIERHRRRLLGVYPL
jgi:hypothetical protein